jgi:hypothetical protein
LYLPLRLLPVSRQLLRLLPLLPMLLQPLYLLVLLVFLLLLLLQQGYKLSLLFYINYLLPK